MLVSISVAKLLTLPPLHFLRQLRQELNRDGPTLTLHIRCMYSEFMATVKDRLNLRVPPEDRELFDQAAEVADESLSRFVLKSSRDRAEQILADRTQFSVNLESWESIIDALDGPARSRTELLELFSRPRPE